MEMLRGVKCKELESFILLTLLIIITILFGALSLVMAFVNYQKVKELISHYCGTWNARKFYAAW